MNVSNAITEESDGNSSSRLLYWVERTCSSWTEDSQPENDSSSNSPSKENRRSGLGQSCKLCSDLPMKTRSNTALSTFQRNHGSHDFFIMSHRGNAVMQIEGFPILVMPFHGKTSKGRVDHVQKFTRRFMQQSWIVHHCKPPLFSARECHYFRKKNPSLVFSFFLMRKE